MISTKTQRTHCNICKSSDCSLLFPDMVLSESGKRGIVRCSHCGLVYRNIRKTEESMLQDYSSTEYPELADGWIAGRKNAFRPYAEMLFQFKKTGHMLDVGAGHGFFLAACQEAGWNCSGVEPSVQCRRFAEQEFGIHLSGDTIENSEFQDESFDLITFWNVLSHLPDPRQTLQHVYRLLRPGGAVVIRSPNAAFHVPTRSILTRMGKVIPRLRSIDETVFHLYSFDKCTISRLLHDVGFRDTRVSPAKLSWTTSHNAASIRSRRFVHFVEVFSRIVYRVTAHRLVLSPSLLAISNRPMQRDWVL